MTHMTMNRFKQNDRGSITVETGLIITVLSVLGMGILDFGLAFNRSMELANAVRAGMQYASVRKPLAGDMSAIENAIKTALPANNRSTDPVINISMICKCPDDDNTPCTSSGGVSIDCSDGSSRQSYIYITLRESYDLLFTYPSVGTQLTLSKSTAVRLN